MLYFIKKIFLSLLLVSLTLGLAPVKAASKPNQANEAKEANDINEARGQDYYKKGRYKEALEVWHKAAQQGSAGAAYRLGAEYLDAKVVARDITKATKYITLAATRGDARGQLELGSLYDQGVGVKINKKRAFFWFMKAAVQNNTVALYNAATFLDNNEHGLVQDLTCAGAYYWKAKQQGFLPFAAMALRSLKTRENLPQEKSLPTVLKKCQQKYRTMDKKF